MKFFLNERLQKDLSEKAKNIFFEKWSNLGYTDTLIGAEAVLTSSINSDKVL